MARKNISFLLIMLLVCSMIFSRVDVAQAATITLYADDCLPYGSGTGTSGDPYCGIQTAIDAIPTNLAGDAYVILVQSGTYIEAIGVAGKNTSATETITIKEQTGQTAIIDGDTLSTWGIHVDGVDYVTIDGFEIMNTYYDGIKCDVAGDYNTYKNNNIHDVKSSAVGGIWLGNSLGAGNGCSNVTIQDNTIHDNDVAGILIADDSVNTVITGNTIYSNTTNGIINLTEAADGTTITSNTIYSNTLRGIHLQNADNNTVTSNIVYNNALVGILVTSTSNSEVSYNTSYSNGTFGIDVSSSTGTTSVHHNLAYDNAGGIAAQGGSGNITIKFNTSYGNECMGILGTASTGYTTTISNNIVANSALVNGGCTPISGALSALGYGGIALFSNAQPYVTAEYNVFYNNGQNGGNDEHVVSLNSGTFARVNIYSTAAEINDDVEVDIAGASFTGNSLGDPQFTDVNGADNILGYSGGNYGDDDDFTESSYGAAVDAADPGESYSNEPEPNGDRANAGRYGNTLLAANSPLSGTTQVTATIDPTLTFVIRNSGDTSDSNTCAFGTFSTGSVTTCAYRLAAETNATNGFTVSVTSDGDLESANSDTITAITEDGTVTAGTEGYGVAITGATGLTEAGDFSDDDTPVPTSSTSLVTKSGPHDYVVSDLTTSTLVTHRAGISALTEAGTYSQILTYTAVANF